MAETTKTLKLTFLNSKNKKTNLSVANPLENLDEQTVRQAMNVISFDEFAPQTSIPRPTDSSFSSLILCLLARYYHFSPLLVKPSTD